MRLFQYRIEHRREVAGRRIDHAQDLSGRSLLIQSLAGLGQQPCILHRNHRLRSEVLEQRDLLVSERANLLTIDRNKSEQDIALPQCRSKVSTSTAQIRKCAPCWIAVLVYFS